ncbi:MAG: nucleoside 2-deoxyribosyltransferase [Polyangia bacterium]
MSDAGRPQRTILVGGPIQHALVGALFSPVVRRQIEGVLEQIRATGAAVLSAHVVEEYGLKTAQLTPDAVSRRDFAWMRACDLFVAVLPVDADGTLLRTDGTYVELGWASALGKPVLVLVPDAAQHGLSHLVQGLRQVTAVRLYDLGRALEEPGAIRSVVGSLLDAAPQAAGHLRASTG